MAKREWLDNGLDGLTFGERLGDLISVRGITQTKLAKVTGVSQSRFSEYVTGKEIDPDSGERKYAAPDCATVIALAKEFGVSTDYLLGLTADPKRHPSDIDQLGISAKAAQNLTTIGRQPNSSDLRNALNLLLEDHRLLHLLNGIAKASAMLRAEIKYLEDAQPNIVINDTEEVLALDGRLGYAFRNRLIVRDAEAALGEAMPHIADRSLILVGIDAIDSYISELGKDISYIFQDTPEYRKLTEQGF